MELNTYQKQVMRDLSGYMACVDRGRICFPRGGNTGLPKMWPLVWAAYRPITIPLSGYPTSA